MIQERGDTYFRVTNEENWVRNMFSYFNQTDSHAAEL
jgi:hypothetical protein